MAGPSTRNQAHGRKIQPTTPTSTGLPDQHAHIQPHSSRPTSPSANMNHCERAIWTDRQATRIQLSPLSLLHPHILHDRVACCRGGASWTPPLTRFRPTSFGQLDSSDCRMLSETDRRCPALRACFSPKSPCACPCRRPTSASCTTLGKQQGWYTSLVLVCTSSAPRPAPNRSRAEEAEGEVAVALDSTREVF